MVLRTEVCSTVIILFVHSAAGRAHILGGDLCPTEQDDSNCTDTSSVDVLDVSQGRWEPFPVPLGSATSWLQVATLDYELGVSLSNEKYC